MSVAPAAIPGQPMSWDEYVRKGSSPPSEYIDGCLVMVPSPTREHQRICLRLATALERVKPPDHEVTLSWPWKPGSDELIPDVMVHPDTAENLRFTGTPLLVVEVLSSNLSDDLVLKTGKYATAGAPHYWIIDPRDRTLDAFDLIDGMFRPVARVTEEISAPVPFGNSTLPGDTHLIFG